ncbi:alpha/beta hydrolase [candidate division KSB3 bacterium]|uniref:Alpha/beta hydrolase n=1 Tax=candidate division KSB3 bacterium TaxID=2044937 RepID=A0A2G6E492_9BACT|nr:MAG: alpha/beta hydrolase [candidate division KSB3 bacterium]PIE29113.1 MAG: alpha/beta hydrolase [candidate division KSB3 bacterium]
MNMAATGDYVIVVHGLGRTGRSMKKAQKFLARKGYHALNFEYPSTKYDIDTLAKGYLATFLENYCREKDKKIHFVTHSMGGILVRNYLAQFPLETLGRVVMLAPPNQGTEVVDRQRHCFLFRWLLGPAGQQLGTDELSLPVKLGPVNFELGVIAGDKSFEFVHSYIIPGADDGKVAVERAKVAGMRDFLLVHKTHTFIMKDRDVLRQAEQFLRTGSFFHERTL